MLQDVRCLTLIRAFDSLNYAFVRFGVLPFIAENDINSFRAS